MSINHGKNHMNLLTIHITTFHTKRYFLKQYNSKLHWKVDSSSYFVVDLSKLIDIPMIDIQYSENPQLWNDVVRMFL